MTLNMNEHTKNEWLFYFYPSESRTERIRKLEALLAHKAANNEPIDQTVRALRVLQQNQRGFLMRSLLVWLGRRKKVVPTLASTIVDVSQNSNSSVIGAILFWLLAFLSLCLLLGQAREHNPDSPQPLTSVKTKICQSSK
jgi:hypothetical protein